MSKVYTANLNTVSNILNRRTETIFNNNITFLTDFDHLLRTRKEYGDTLEFLTKAIAPKKVGGYDPASEVMANYVETILDKYYATINIDHVYYASTNDDEYKKALLSPKSLAELSSRVVNSMNESWAIDLYKAFNDKLSVVATGDVSQLVFDTESGTFDDMTPTEKEVIVDKVLVSILNKMKDMKFYGNKYITVDSTLTADQQSRIVANARYENLTLYIHYEWYSLIQSRLSKRLRDLFDLDNKIKIVEFNPNVANGNYKPDHFICHILHNNYINYYPRTITAKEVSPLDAIRVDHALIVQGTMTVNQLAPSFTMLTMFNEIV